MISTALYRRGDIIALALQPEQAAGMVCEDQRPGAQHIKVHRTNQPVPELLRLDDIVPFKLASEVNTCE